MIEIPVRVNLGVSESQQQYNLGVSESQQQVNVSPEQAIVAEKNYNRLNNKPSIDNVTLEGNITLEQLGLKHIYYGTKSHWQSQMDLITEAGAVYIYSDYYVQSGPNNEEINYPAIKIGDGTTYLVDLPILYGNLADLIAAHIQNAIVHVTQDDKRFWNNKSSAFLDKTVDEETLVLSNTKFMIEGVLYEHA